MPNHRIGSAALFEALGPFTPDALELKETIFPSMSLEWNPVLFITLFS